MNCTDNTGWTQPPRLVDTVERRTKADLLSTVSKIRHDAKSTRRRQNANGDVWKHRFKKAKMTPSSQNVGISTRFVIFDVAKGV